MAPHLSCLIRGNFAGRLCHSLLQKLEQENLFAHTVCYKGQCDLSKGAELPHNESPNTKVCLETLHCDLLGVSVWNANKICQFVENINVLIVWKQTLRLILSRMALSPHEACATRFSELLQASCFGSVVGICSVYSFCYIHCTAF